MKPNKPKHISGPWEIDTESFDGEETWIVSTAEDRAVCLIGVHRSDEQFYCGDETAALIAAAPDMYSMLEAIANDRETSGFNDTQGIRNLLAKARGES